MKTKINKHSKAYRFGYKAWKGELDYYADNPYRRGTTDFKEWQAGWNSANEKDQKDFYMNGRFRHADDLDGIDDDWWKQYKI